MLYKRRSLIAETFSIPQIVAVFPKIEFFNSHAWLQQLRISILRQNRALLRQPDFAHQFSKARVGTYGVEQEISLQTYEL
jgi:hypothetical protein